MSSINISQKRRETKKFDTVNIAPIPIVLVPGVMGSRLEFPVDPTLPPPPAVLFPLIRPGFRAPDWDPDSTGEMVKWIPIRQRLLAQALSSASPATVKPLFSAMALQTIVPNPTLGGIAATFGGGLSVQNFYEARGWAGVAFGFYGQALITLESTFNGFGLHPVHAVGYDWRQSCRGNGVLLQAQIAAILRQHQATKCIVLTHSMGGLVTRAALLAGAQGNILAVIHCVIPSEGAVVAYRRFHTGATMALDGGITNFGLQQILGVTPLEYAVTQAGLPGPLELLPTNEYPGVFLTAPNGQEANTKNPANPNSLGDVFSAYALNVPPGIVPTIGAIDNFPTVPLPIVVPTAGIPSIPIFIGLLPAPIPMPRLQVTATDVANLTANLFSARKFHSDILGQVHPNTAILLGNTNVTDTAFNWPLRLSGARGAGVSQTPAGDGTVPVASARFDVAGRGPTGPERQVFPVEHSTCLSNQDFLAEVVRQISKFLGRRVGPRVFPPSPPSPTPAPAPFPTPAPAPGATPPFPPPPPAPPKTPGG